MLLAIDAGNTNIVFALMEGETIHARWRIATDPRRTADEYAVWLSQLLALEGHQRSDVDGVMIGTVVPRALHNLQVLARKYFGTEPVIAGSAAAPWGFPLDVDEPPEQAPTVTASPAAASDVIMVRLSRRDQGRRGADPWKILRAIATSTTWFRRLPPSREKDNRA